MRRVVLSLVYTGVGLYAALCVAMYAAQRSFQYFPGGPLPPPPAGFQVLPAPSGGVLGWLKPPSAPDAAVVAYFHGNAGTIADRLDKLAPFHEAGQGVLFVEYPGYGGNPGRITEASILAQARAALDALATHHDGPVALYGESLGSGVAVAMATERPVAALLLEAPFTSTAAVAQKHYPYLPAYWLLKDRFDSLRRIDDVTTPLLVLLGERDRTVPPDQSRRLHAAANDPKHLMAFPHATHNDLADHGAIEAAVAFLIETVQPAR